MASQQLLLGTAAADSGTDIYPDDNFRMLDYRGTGAWNNKIVNGIDFVNSTTGGLSGGMVMIKNWESSKDWIVSDTVRGKTKRVKTNSTGVEGTSSTQIQSFNKDGITVGLDSDTNTSNEHHLAYCFRRRAKFFDVVTYTGNGNNSQSIAHNLGCVPGMIWVKNLSDDDHWGVYHRGLNNGSNPHTYRIRFPAFNQEAQADYWGNTAPTSTHFTVGSDGETGANGDNYVAYLFAHNENAFGPNEDKPMSYCGWYTGQGGSSSYLNMGFEPQFLILNRVTGGTSYHYVIDNQRGMTPDQTNSNNDPWMGLNGTGASSGYNFGYFTNNGFYITPNNSDINHSGSRYIYYAVRAQDGKTSPTDPKGSEIFSMGYGDNTTDASPQHKTNFKVSFGMYRNPTATENHLVYTRGAMATSSGQYMQLQSNNGQAGNSSFMPNHHDGFIQNESSVDNDFHYAWKESATFHRMIYTGSGGNYQMINHNLGSVPTMMWAKALTHSDKWIVYHKYLNNSSGTNAADKYIELNDYSNPTSSDTRWYSMPTASYFAVGGADETNKSGSTYQILLFTDGAGVSKIGRYDGSDSAQTLTLGFKPRFFLVRCISEGDHWYAVDTTRGWGSGNDTYCGFNYNSPDASDADFGTPVATGIDLPGNSIKCNKAGRTFIYYAHA